MELLLEKFLTIIVDLVDSFGYFGIFFMTFLESTFIPIPSEITMIPAGYLIAKGELNFILVFLCSMLGTVLGALTNYIIAYHYGRKLLINYGKYFFLSPAKLAKIELFFQKYGRVSTFFGRMLPGIKHFISFPAGLGKMNIKLFTLYTALGGAIWLLLLLILGYYIGTNEALVKKYIKHINLSIILIVSFVVVFYSIRSKKST